MSRRSFVRDPVNEGVHEEHVKRVAERLVAKWMALCSEKVVRKKLGCTFTQRLSGPCESRVLMRLGAVGLDVLNIHYRAQILTARGAQPWLAMHLTFFVNGHVPPT